MLPPKVQIATSTFHKYWTNRWPNFMETSDSIDTFTNMVNQVGSAFGTAIKAEVLFKKLQKKNKLLLNKVSQANEITMKAKVEAKAIRK